MKRKVVFINPELFQQMQEDGDESSSLLSEPETREMLIKNNYVLYYCDSGREFYFEKKIEKNEDIPLIKREAFEALVLFKSNLKETTDVDDALDVKL